MIRLLKAGPFFKPLDQSKTDFKNLSTAFDSYLKSHHQDIYADDAAIRFYFLNHVSQILTMDGDGFMSPAREEFFKEYQRESTYLAERAFYYLLIICSREFRHTKNYSHISNMIMTSHGPAADNALSTIAGAGSGSVLEFLRKYPGTVPFKVGDYVKALVTGFYNGKFNGGYGGPAWGRVADCLCDFVFGVSSTEIMLDTVWTLAHNNGPIFNKPFLFLNHTSDLVKILDVQRSGQIPQLLFDYSENIVYFQSTLKNNKQYYLKILSMLDKDYRLQGHIDWYKVEALGAVGSYKSYQTAQDTKVIPSFYKALPVKAKMVIKPEPYAAPKPSNASWPPPDHKMFTVAPGLKLKKLKREEL